MSYVDGFLDRDRDIINIVERVNGQRVYREYPARYTFYYPDNRGKFTSIFGDKLERVVCNTGKKFAAEKKMHGHNTLFESDINPVFRCLAETYMDADAPNLHLAFFDIEVDFNKDLGFASPDDPFNAITAIAVHLSWLKRTVCLTIKPKTLTKEAAQTIVEKFDDTILFDTEAELLESFIALIDDVDVLSGWNSEGFDIPYTVNRIQRVLSKSHTRQLCLWDKFPKAKTVTKFGKENGTYELIGRVHLDYLELYRKYTYHEMHSYSLDAIGEYELDERKVEYEGTLDQLYHNDFEKFIAYNRQDVDLLVQLDKKLQFIDLANVLAHSNTVLLQTTMGAVAQTDQAIVNEAHLRGLIVPDKNRSETNYQPAYTRNVQAAGAYVADPVTGMHRDIGSVDLNSLYPSILRAGNMSTETIVGQVRHVFTAPGIEECFLKYKESPVARYWEGRFATQEYELVINRDTNERLYLDFENGESYELTGAEIYELIFNSGEPWIISANGTIFTYAKKGIIPGLLERWYAERKDLQKKARDFKGVDEEQFAFWDKRQLVKKINLNSLYGALLNPGSRFNDPRLGQSTTLTGRCIAKHMAAELNHVIAGEYDHRGKAIVYGDTDSTYFSAYPMLKKQIDAGEIIWDKDTVIKYYDAVCEQVNESFPNFMNRAFHTTLELGEIIAAGREVVGESGIFITKKRYAILVYDLEGKREDINGKPGKIKAMGLDLKRSDTPGYMQEFLSEILMMVLTGVDEAKVIARIVEFRMEFRDKPSWEKGTPKRVNNLTNHTRIFQKTGKCGIGHALAAINWNRLKKMNSDAYSIDITDGMKTIVCKLKRNPMGITSIGYPTDEKRIPDWFKAMPFDDDAMEAAIITSKIDNLIGGLNWDLSSSLAKNTFSDLFNFG
jgi:DNA polymerase elongation subunit (family B)